MSHSESPLALKNFPFDQLLSKDKRGLTSKNFFSVPFKLSFKVVITQISASSILDYQARRLGNKWSFLIRFHFMLMTDVLCLIVLIAESQRYFLPLWNSFLWVIIFENHQKMPHFNFSPIFVLLKLTCLVTRFSETRQNCRFFGNFYPLKM